MFGLGADKLLILVVLAAVLLGPSRLLSVSERLGRMARSLKHFSQQAGERVRDEIGPEFDEIDWHKLDPRQYDPRQIIARALFEESSKASLTGEASLSAIEEQRSPRDD
jgi:sec-independent protein translocase protein TatB